MSDFHGKSCGDCKHFMPSEEGRRSGRCKKRPFIRCKASKKFTDIPLIVYYSKNACTDYDAIKKLMEGEDNKQGLREKIVNILMDLEISVELKKADIYKFFDTITKCFFRHFRAVLVFF